MLNLKNSRIGKALELYKRKLIMRLNQLYLVGKPFFFFLFALKKWKFVISHQDLRRGEDSIVS